MEKVWVLKCPKCSKDLPQGVRKEEVLYSLKINCLSCKWEGFANEAIKELKDFNDWMGKDYADTDPSQSQIYSMMDEELNKNPSYMNEKEKLGWELRKRAFEAFRKGEKELFLTDEELKKYGFEIGETKEGEKK